MFPISPNLASFAPLRESSFLRFPKLKFNGKFQISLDSVCLLICGVSPDLVQSEDVKSLVLLADVDASPPVHQDIFRLHHELAGPDPDPFFRVRRYEVGYLLGTPLVTDVVNPQAGVEVGEVGDVVSVLEAELVV